jgi:purine-binding chemotaxis protein CheW
LVFHAGRHLCALRLEDVVEIMRPLPVEPLAGAPPFIAGVCVIRGEPAPVVDAATLVGGGDHHVTRYISVKAETGPRRPEAGERRCPLVFAVDSVLGVWEIPSGSLRELPPLLGAVNSDLISALGVIGTEPLLFLRSARLLPDAVWAARVPAPADR